MFAYSMYACRVMLCSLLSMRMVQQVQHIWHMAGAGSITRAGVLRKAGWLRLGALFGLRNMLFIVLGHSSFLAIHQLGECCTHLFIPACLSSLAPLPCPSINAPGFSVCIKEAISSHGDDDSSDSIFTSQSTCILFSILCFALYTVFLAVGNFGTVHRAFCTHRLVILQGHIKIFAFAFTTDQGQGPSRSQARSLLTCMHGEC